MNTEAIRVARSVLDAAYEAYRVADNAYEAAYADALRNTARGISRDLYAEAAGVAEARQRANAAYDAYQLADDAYLALLYA
jgi:hypothetical protein